MSVIKKAKRELFLLKGESREREARENLSLTRGLCSVFPGFLEEGVKAAVLPG